MMSLTSLKNLDKVVDMRSIQNHVKLTSTDDIHYESLTVATSYVNLA